MTARHDILAALGCSIRTWGISPAGLSANGSKDTKELSQFLHDNPLIAQAVATNISRPRPAADGTDQNLQEREPSAGPAANRNSASESCALPANPMHLSKAVSLYVASGNFAERTSIDKGRLLGKLISMVVRSHPHLGSDPFVHDISTHHLSAFLDANTRRHSTAGAQTEEDASPKTQVKKVLDLQAFFRWAHQEREASLSDPAAGLARRGKDLKKAAAKAPRHYAPFQTKQIVQIFAPRTYLASNRRADYFWAPLLALHMGMRLKEVVTLSLCDIGRHDEAGLWYLDVTPEEAKNRNSVRRLPIPERLLDIGFIVYVERVRSLGGARLFPHLDFNSTTVKRDPGKNCSRAFGAYLGTLGLNHPDLVFHSFRHTVVSALQDAGVPLTDSMQITGHQAQEHAVKTGRMTQTQSQSVHIKVYTHADKARLNVEYPLARLKDYLDRSVNIGLEYATLAQAAAIVSEHTIRSGTGFASGWSALGRQHERLLARLD